MNGARRSALIQAALASLAAAGMLAGGLVLVFGGQDWRNAPPVLPPESVRSTELPAEQAFSQSPALPKLGHATPVSLAIPSIGVHTSLMKLGLQPDGTIAVPPLGKKAPAGWYRYLSSPGQPGPAVIVGHVDSARDGPAVFYRLGDLRPGETFTITRDDGWLTIFTVRKIGVYSKTSFPSDEVYGSVPDAEVRLVTCGGPFDRASRHYRDNIVVFAELTAAQRV